MGISLDPGQVARDLPGLDAVVGDPRMRPIGLVGGCLFVFVGALLQLAGPTAFWSTVMAGLLVFLGVPLAAVGLAAPEPAEGWFTLGVDLSDTQRHVVGIGAGLTVASPMTVAVLGTLAGFEQWVWLVGGGLAVVGAVLILTGFVAWTSAAVGGASSSR